MPSRISSFNKSASLGLYSRSPITTYSFERKRPPKSPESFWSLTGQVGIHLGQVESWEPMGNDRHLRKSDLFSCVKKIEVILENSRELESTCSEGFRWAPASGMVE